MKPHLYGQCKNHVAPFFEFTPKWFIDCGPGSGCEAREMWDVWPSIKIIGCEPSAVGREAARELYPPKLRIAPCLFLLRV